ncbi:MAG: InlB B-repeat-containing protein, partial [Butyricicoccus sp.]|nr:InlB B-repeat-containing protein [Butyricicoccus sp.]
TVEVAAPAAETKVEGKVESVAVAETAEGAKTEVGKNAEVKDMTVAAPKAETSVSGKVENVAVEETAAGAAITANNGAKIDSVTTAAEDVKVDGAKDTIGNIKTEAGSADIKAEGAQVENTGADTTVDGEKVDTGTTTESTQTGGTTSSSGGSDDKTTYKYNVKIKSAKGGKVTADIKGSNEANQTVTLTVTPNAQNGDTMPYVLKSLTLTAPEAPADESADAQSNEPITIPTIGTGLSGENGTYTFTMANEGDYIITPEFYQPITKAAVMHVDGKNVQIQAMGAYNEAFGLESEEVTNTKLAETNGYLFIGVVKENKEDTLTNLAVKFDGVDKASTIKWDGKNAGSTGFKNVGCVYIDGAIEGDNGEGNKDTNMGFKGSTANIVVTFTYKGASYELTTTYTAKDVDTSTLKTVTFKAVDEKGKAISGYSPIAEFKGKANTKTDAFTAPAIPKIEGYYAVNSEKWYSGDEEATVPSSFESITDDTTYTAKYIKIKNAATQIRIDGNEDGEDTKLFSYNSAYNHAGISFSSGRITIKQSNTVSFKDNKNYAAELAGIKVNAGDADYLMVGIAVKGPAGATKVKVGEKEITSAGTGTDLYTGDDGSVWFVQYYGAIKADGTALDDKAFDPLTLVWMDKDGGILKVETFTVNRRTTLAKYTVTFKDGNSTVATKTAGYKGTVELPDNPTKDGYTFDGWKVGTGDDATKFTASTEVTGNVTVNATWTKVEQAVVGEGGGE